MLNGPSRANLPGNRATGLLFHDNASQFLHLVRRRKIQDRVIVPYSAIAASLERRLYARWWQSIIIRQHLLQ